MSKKICLLLVLFFLTGCNYSAEKDTDLSLPESNIEEKYEYAHGVKGFNFEKWQYNGEPLVFEYDFVNYAKDLELGLMICIDGIVQEYTVDNQNYNLYTVDLKGKETKTITINLSPNVGELNQSYTMHCFTILNPSKKIEDVKEYGNNHHILQSAPIKIEFLKSVIQNNQKNEIIDIRKEDIATEFLKEYQKENEDLLLRDIYLNVYQNNQLNMQEISRGSLVEVAGFGKPGEYRVLMLEDMVATNYFEIQLDLHSYSIFQIPELKKTSKNLFFIIIPKDTDNDSLINQSERLIVK